MGLFSPTTYFSNKLVITSAKRIEKAVRPRSATIGTHSFHNITRSLIG
jgi:hypothetical protein